MIRRLKEKVLTQLPAKRRQIITIEVPPGQCRIGKVSEAELEQMLQAPLGGGY
jgi:hypothetical protein